MTQQEALAAALRAVIFFPVVGVKSLLTYEDAAAAIIAALPNGWGLTTTKQDRALYEEGQAFGAQQERKRLRALLKKEMPRKASWPEFGPLFDGVVAARAAFEMATEMALDLLSEPEVSSPVARNATAEEVTDG